MERRNYIWINGEFTPDDQPVINLHNRSFAYGDGFFETIHSYGTEAMYIEFHLTRIYRSLSILGMEQPTFLTKEFLAKGISRLLNKNRIFGSARVRITIFRNKGGLYAPSDNSIGLVIQSAGLPQNFYPINPKGLVVDLYSEIRKPINILSPIKSCNALIYVMAGQYKQQQKLDDCLLINDQNRIVEAISSNIFVVKGNNIFTPSIEEGCVAGVMRKVVIDLAKRNGYKVIDNGALEADKLMEADEVFLTNAISGIQWVVGLRQKRYFGIVSKKLSFELNKETFPDQFKDGFSG